MVLYKSTMSNGKAKKKILFVCECNSARSQIAEGMLRKLYGHEYDAYSAGIRPGKLDPKAIKVMKEIGVDISLHYAKDLKGYIPFKFDTLALVCDRAAMMCEDTPKAKNTLKRGFSDPAVINAADELEPFRKTREEMREWIKTVFG